MEKKESARKIKKVQRPSSSSSSSSDSSSSSTSSDNVQSRKKASAAKKRKLAASAKKVVSKKVYHAERKIKKNPEKKHALDRIESSRVQLKQRKVSKKEPRTAIIEKEIHDPYRSAKRDKLVKYSREYDHKSPDRGRSPLSQKYSPSLVSSRRHETSKERDRREREIARQKERDDALARSQERQRERERLKRLEREDGGLDKPRIRTRLLPTANERARALAIAVARSPDRYTSRSPRSRGRRSRSLKYDSEHDRDRGYYRRSRSGSHKEHVHVRERDYERREKSPTYRREYEYEHRRHDTGSSSKDWDRDRHPSEITASSSSRKWEEAPHSPPKHYNPPESEQWTPKSYYYESKTSSATRDDLPTSSHHPTSRRWTSTSGQPPSDWHHKKDPSYEYTTRPHLRMKGPMYRGTPPSYHGARMPFSHRGSAGGGEYFQRSRYSIDRRPQQLKIKEGAALLSPRVPLETSVAQEEELKTEQPETEGEPVQSSEVLVAEPKVDVPKPEIVSAAVGASQVTEEDIEDNLSEFSDGADEILNQEEKLSAEQIKLEEGDSKSDELAEFDKSSESMQKANKELKEEMDLDFEEISDGELEEELKFKGFGDALGVDWASLRTETCKPVIKDDNLIAASRKWLGHNVLLEIGISFKYAGKEFAEEMLKKAHAKKVLEEKEILKLKSNEISPTIKTEHDVQNEPEPEEEFKILSPIASVQVGLRERELKEKNLFKNLTGPFCRALCKRRDMKLRRYLLGLPSRKLPEDRMVVDEKLKQEAIDLFRRYREQSKMKARIEMPEIAIEGGL